MKWSELLNTLSDGRLCVLSLATTGLHPDSGDSIFGYAIRGIGQIEDPATDESYAVLRNDIDMHRFQQSQEFHKFTPEDLHKHGMPRVGFAEDLKDDLKDKVVLTYNVKFFEPFLKEFYNVFDVMPTLIDLPKLYHFGYTYCYLGEDKSRQISEMNKIINAVITKAPSMTNLAKYLKLDDMVMRPLFKNTEILRLLLTKLTEYDVVM